ncbi:tripartite tricarboxylate transporter TctB family protein [Leucobacter chromiireducens]|uniref:tripartite tricarboxylate transporter TctB family protein n=1 Tax=Leucobacter chromiireducens TaxID=283877 RepID=UPI000F631974|nr:tripartite tricarboxylate transporter TctB family protein [Leucobacter chromiireducens]
MPTNNPTAMSAVVGEEIQLAAGRGRRAALLKELIMPALLVGFAAYLLVGNLTMRVPEGTAFPGPRFFPGIIAAGLLLFAVLRALGALREWRRAAVADPAAADPAAAGAPVRVDWRSLAWVVLPFIGFALLLPVLGWIIAAGLLFWCVARAFGLRRPLASLIVGLTVSSIIYIAFDLTLGMSLPSGVLGWEF